MGETWGLSCLFASIEITVDSRVVERNNTERSDVLFTRLPPIVTSCIIQCHNQDIEVDTAH